MSKDKHGRDVTVGPSKHSEGWEVKVEGNERATRVTETKEEAENIARERARKEESELIIKGRDGRIQRRDSHGHDPRRRKG